MTPLKEAIEQTAEVAKKLLAENPTMCSVSFELTGYPVEEVKEAAKSFDREAEFMPSTSRFGFLTSVAFAGHIHVRSVEVKAKVVYE